jgi:hypothetical protein
MRLRGSSFQISMFKEQSSKTKVQREISNSKEQNPNNIIAAGDATFELCSLNFGLCFL